MEVKLYVGNLSYQTTEDDLRTLFSGAGTVTSVALIKDRDTGRSKGFAFIEMSSQSEAEQAIKALDGSDVDSRQIKVNKAQPMKPRPSSGYSNNYSDKGGSKKRKRRGGTGGSRRY